MSEQTKHTPGKWRTIIADGDPRPVYVATDDPGPMIAYVYGGKHERANASLIAAAPDLLRALKTAAMMIETLARLRGGSDSGTGFYHKIIARAESRQPVEAK